MKPFHHILLVCLLGFLIGSVGGSLLDTLIQTIFFSKGLLSNPISLEFYTIKIEVQLTPASIIGLVVSAYFVIKKG